MWQLATVDWTQAAGVATFVSVVVGGVYVSVKWVRGLLRQEIREVVAPMFDQVQASWHVTDRKMDHVNDDIRSHMQMEDDSRDATVIAVHELGDKLERQIAQLQWRSKDLPGVVEEDKG